EESFSGGLRLHHGESWRILVVSGDRDMEIRVIVVVHSDPVKKSFPWCQAADELGDGLHVS
ncbi:hypothetical protein H0E87_021637, partial [Populus deltoides]